jgi:hypothetical protein
MADIFISFHTKDTERVRAVHDAFIARGLTVFWCDAIPKGAPNYQTILLDELTEATAVVVLWTHNSVKSNPVIQECSQAERYQKLFQVVFDEHILPMQFPMEIPYKAQKTMLIRWSGDAEDPEWKKLNDAIDARIEFVRSERYKTSAGRGRTLLDNLRDLKRRKPR